MKHKAFLIKQGDYSKYGILIDENQYLAVSYMSSGMRHVSIESSPTWCDSEEDAMKMYNGWAEYGQKRNIDIIVIREIC